MIDRARAVGIGKMLVAVGLIAFLVTRIDPAEVGDALRRADPRYCVLGFAVFFALGAVDILRLYVVFARYPLSLAGAAHLYFTGMFFANLIPGSLGAEVYKVHLLRQLENDTVRPIALLLLVRVSGLVVLVAMASAYLAADYPRLGVALGPVVARAHLSRAVPAIVVGLLVAAGLLVAVLPAGRRVLRRGRGRARDVWAVVSQVVVTRLPLLLGLGVLVWICRVSAIYWFARALKAHPLFLDVLLVVAFVNIVSLLPISFASLGVREGAITIGLAAFGVSASHALGVALLSRSAQWAVSLVGGALYLARGRVAREQLVG